MAEVIVTANVAHGSPRPRVLVAVPAFNEEVGIGSVVLKARQYADEVLVVDDGSSDATAEVASMAGATVVTHAQNGGKAKGVRTALRYALEKDYDALVLIDGDGQHEAREIPQLLEPILGRNGHSVDVALGFRFGGNTEMPAWRRVGKRVLDYATAGAAKGEVTDSQCGFRAFNRKAIRTLSRTLKGDGFSVESETLVVAKEAGLSMENVTIHCRYDGIDGSTKGPVAHAAGVLNSLVTAVAMRRPLLTVGLPSMALLLGAIVAGLRALQVFQATATVPVALTVIAATLVIVGTLGVFFALTLNMMIMLEKRLQATLSA